MEEDTTGISIYSLPDEILIAILRYTSYTDCNSFRRTCTKYSELIKNSNSLWKMFYRNTVDDVIYRNTESSGDWQSKLKQYLTLKESLIQIIANMPSKHCRFNEILMLYDAKEFFDIALSSNSNTNYYCVIVILQEFIMTANKKINTLNTERPYTLTEVHFAKSVLGYLFHILLTFKWTQYKITNQLTPDIVLNFFTQWIDPLKMHRDEELSSLISDMIKDVDKKLLMETNNKTRLPGEDTKNTCPRGFYSERQVITAVSHYIYKERRMVLEKNYKKDTLCIVKSIKTNTLNIASSGAIFQAIARGFGITTCRLISVPGNIENMYLEWWPNDLQGDEKLYINLSTGELQTWDLTPFSIIPIPDLQKLYVDPEKLIKFILMYYGKYASKNRNWPLEFSMMHFLTFVKIPNSTYCDFEVVHTYLQGCDREKLLLPFSLENVHQEHLNYISDFVNLLCMSKRPSPPPPLIIQVKKRSASLLYCVGMICRHKLYEYICVIRGWDLQCLTLGPPKPEQNITKPFYYITAVNRSNRYISQDHLQILNNPSRIFDLEDAISNDFTHFNGFFYEPNAEKQLSYPEDMAIGMAYSSKRCQPRIPRELTSEQKRMRVGWCQDMLRKFNHGCSNSVYNR